MSDVIGRGVIEVEVSDAGVAAGIAKIEHSVDQLGQSASAAGKQAAAGIQQIGGGGEAAAAKVDASTRNMIGSIQRATAAMEAGSRGSVDYFRALAGQRGVDARVLQPYLAQLEAVSERQTSAGMSARQMSAAMSNLPAQFTDIVVSLQSGQQPLTVLLQQGGQLKDMFGGVGPAARALGGYIVGLVNPYTVAAAAAVALAYAYHEGSKEADAYAKALINTNNAAGISANAMADMARRIDGVVGTQAAAAEALAALAGSGNVAAVNLERFGAVAVAAAATTGTAVGDIAEQFSELGNEPLKAALKLDESMRFLTASTYEQIKALEEQGRAAQAADVAQNAYADTLATRTKEMDGNLGTIERGWIAIKNAVKEAGDALLNIGRKETLAEQIATKRTALANAKANAGNFSQPGWLIPQLTAELDALESDARRLQTDAQRDAEREQTRKAGVAAAKYLDNLSDSIANSADKRAKAIKKYREEVASLKAAGGGAEYTPERMKADEARIADKYKDPKTPAAKKVNPYGTREDRDTAQLTARIAAERQLADSLERYGAAADKLTEGEKLALKYRAEVGAATGDTAKAHLKAAARMADELGALQSLNKATGERIALSKALDEVDRQRAFDLGLQLEDARKQIEFMAMGDERRARAQALWEIEKREKQELFALDKKLNEALAEQAAAEERLAEIRKTANAKAIETAQKTVGEKVAIVADLRGAQTQARLGAADARELANRSADDRLAMQGDGMTAARRALENYADRANNVADQVGSVFNTMTNGMESALTQFFTTGKLGWKNFASAILTEIMRIQAAKMAAGLLTAAASMFAGPATAGASSGLSTGGTNVGSPDYVPSYVAQANGGAWLDGVQYFANGGAFTNNVVSRPTAFAHAGGLGVMGEAGPEAILPLTRDAQGRLGVSAAGGGGLTVNVINNAGVDVRAEERQGPGGRELIVLIDARIDRKMAGAVRNGGMYYGGQR